MTSFSNVPYWSICYEGWYYIGFGVLTFMPRNRAWALIGLIILVLGPKILLLAPVWAMGVWLFRSPRLAGLSEAAGWVLVAATVAAISAFIVLDVEHAVAARLQAVLRNTDLLVRSNNSRSRASSSATTCSGFS